jgi:osmotically-inducible protein OsmY
MNSDRQPRPDDTGNKSQLDPVIIARNIVGINHHSALSQLDRSVADKLRIDVESTATRAKGFGGGVSSPSDADLAQSALSAITRTELVPVGCVRPIVRNGWLILEGEVEGPLQKRAAEDAIRGLNGIRGMSNNILFESEVMAQRVSKSIDETFTRSARLSAHRIAVTARNHTIILSGAARTDAEREEAETAAWGVPGVAEVVNRIRAPT